MKHTHTHTHTHTHVSLTCAAITSFTKKYVSETKFHCKRDMFHCKRDMFHSQNTWYRGMHEANVFHSENGTWNMLHSQKNMRVNQVSQAHETQVNETHIDSWTCETHIDSWTCAGDACESDSSQERCGVLTKQHASETSAQDTRRAMSLMTLSCLRFKCLTSAQDTEWN